MLYFVGRALVDQWIAFRSTPLVAHPRWGAIASSGAMVLAVYGLLVQTWRVLLAEAGESLPFIRAAGIWSISNLWRYVPGKLWQIGAMSGLAASLRLYPSAAERFMWAIGQAGRDSTQFLSILGRLDELDLSLTFNGAARHEDLATTNVLQACDDVLAEKPGPAGDQNSHAFSPSCLPI